MFLSIVVVVRDAAGPLTDDLTTLSATLRTLVADYEIVVVDNASRDDTVERLRALTLEGGLPNLQILALTSPVDADTAVWVGLDNAIGDFVAVYDPATDAADALAAMLERARAGADVVFAVNEARPAAGMLYRALGGGFALLYALFHGVRFVSDAPAFRMVSRSVVNLVLKHPTPAFTWRQLAQLAGFAQAHVRYRSAPRGAPPRSLGVSIDRGLRLLVSTTRAPLRSVTWLSTVAASLNVLYSGYVIAVYLLKDDVAPGWTTLSLQTSGMFFLISLILLVLGEYVLQLTSALRTGPTWHVAREFTSASMVRQRQLNVVDAPDGA